jgi:LPS-assembly protein
VIIRKNDLPDDTQQNLPSVDFAGSKQKISDTPLYFDLESSCDHFWREVGTRGYSADLHPRVYYPVRLGKYFDFEPSVGVRETLWQVEEYGDEASGREDQLQSREMYDLKADLSTEISKVFNLKGRIVDKIKHAVRPQVVYEYIPDLNQEDLPDFVGTIAEENLVTYSLTNNFTARASERPKQDSETQLEGKQEQGSLLPKFSYYDFCRIKLTQSYDITEARREENGEERRPFSPVKGEVEFRLSRYVDLQADAEWSLYDDEFKSYNSILIFCDRRGDMGSVDYRYTREDGNGEPGTRSILTKVLLKLFDPVSVYWEHERNLMDDQDVKSVIGFKYEPQCWSLDFSFTDDRDMDEREYAVAIALYGLGEFGLGQ